MHKLDKYFEYEPITDSWHYKNFIITINELGLITLNHNKLNINTLIFEQYYGDIRLKKMLDWDLWLIDHISEPSFNWAYTTMNSIEFSPCLYGLVITLLDKSYAAEKMFTFKFKTYGLKSVIKNYLKNFDKRAFILQLNFLYNKYHHD